MGRVYRFDHLNPYTVQVPLQSEVYPVLPISIGRENYSVHKASFFHGPATF